MTDPAVSTLYAKLRQRATISSIISTWMVLIISSNSRLLFPKCQTILSRCKRNLTLNRMLHFPAVNLSEKSSKRAKQSISILHRMESALKEFTMGRVTVWKINLQHDPHVSELHHQSRAFSGNCRSPAQIHRHLFVKGFKLLQAKLCPACYSQTVVSLVFVHRLYSKQWITALFLNVLHLAKVLSALWWDHDPEWEKWC